MQRMADSAETANEGQPVLWLKRMLNRFSDLRRKLEPKTERRWGKFQASLPRWAGQTSFKHQGNFRQQAPTFGKAQIR
jgi:hypothetical protein